MFARSVAPEVRLASAIDDMTTLTGVRSQGGERERRRHPQPSVCIRSSDSTNQSRARCFPAVMAASFGSGTGSQAMQRIAAPMVGGMLRDRFVRTILMRRASLSGSVGRGSVNFRKHARLARNLAAGREYFNHSKWRRL